MPETWRVRVVARDGTPSFGDGDDAGFLDNAAITNGPVWAINDFGRCEIVLHLADALAAEVRLVEHEVQVWRGEDMVWWGVPVRIDIDLDAQRFRVQCFGLLWYFSRRYFGKADRQNFLLNPNFEDGLDHWTAVDTTAEASTELPQYGATSAKLTQADGDQEAYLTQTVTVTGTGVGSLFTLAAWCIIPSATWHGAAHQHHGLILHGILGGVSQGVGDGPISIDEKTPKDTPVKLVTRFPVPASTTMDLEVRLYSPSEVIYWKATSLTLMESDPVYEDDQALLAEAWIQHGQDATFGRSDLNIGTDCPITGVVRFIPQQYAEHKQILSELRRLREPADGIDFDVVTTDTTRTFTTYSPRKGSYRPEQAITAGDVSQVTSWHDGTNAFNSIILSYAGQYASRGPENEEGAATDPTSFGGVTLERVDNAATTDPIDVLDAKAAEQLRTTNDPRAIVITVPAEGRVGALSIGDSIPVDITVGALVIAGVWRVTSLEADAAADALTMGLEPAIA